MVVIRLINHTPSNWPQEMTQYCYFHTPVPNRILISNYSVSGVVAVNISFWKLKLLLQKCSFSLHWLTLLHFGCNRFKCLGKRQVAVICISGNEPSCSIICRELLDWLRNNYLLTKDRVPYNVLEIEYSSVWQVKILSQNQIILFEDFSLVQRFSNCGPRTTSGHWVLPFWSS